MKEQLIKSMKHNQIVSMMYIAQDGKVSKRSIKIIKIIGDSFQAYCFSRKAKRTFTISNVLAVVPVIHKECEIIC
ncbi:transcriptional regulator [Lysinibacillus sp. NPDC047702]|uniref:transcriptional regulator n=1 Tax=unclassified Lysinibacillus TaxID=2636778 RepID=UPI003CFE8DC3